MRTFRWAAGLLVLSMMCGRATAQQSGSVSYGSLGLEAYAPDISRSQVDVLARVLKLSDEERASLVELFQAHDNEVRGEGRQVRVAIRDINEEAELMQNQKLLKKAQEKGEAWEKRKKQLEKKFLDDVTSLLTSEQEARWPIVERELRRPRLMAGGWMSGESVDVIDLVAEVAPKAADQPEVVEVLERYATRIDVALKERDDFVKAHEQEYRDAVKSDPARALSLLKDSVRNRVKVRDINESAVKEIAAKLDPGTAARLTGEFEKRCFVWMERRSKAQLYAEAALKVPGMAESARTSVEAALKQYITKSKELDSRTLAAYRQWEQDRVPQNLRLALNGEPPNDHENEFSLAPEESPLAKARREKLLLDRELRSKVDGLLTDEQKQGIPYDIEGGPTFFSFDQDGQL